MIKKISKLVISAHAELGLPSEMKIKGCDIDSSVFYTDAIFLPAVVALTNTLHYRATGNTLIKLDGGIRKSSEAPFGLTLDGDIDLSSTETPLGLIEQCIKTTLRSIQPMYDNDQFETFSLHLSNEVLHEIKSGEEIPEKLFLESDLLLGTV